MTNVDAFYGKYRQPAVAWATALTGRVDVGEEIAQEALLATAERLETIDEPGAFLRVCVVNSCRSWHRSSEREQRRAERAHLFRPTTAPGPLTEASIEMLDLLETLPYRQRAAVLLRFWAGWSDAEIASALGCRTASVRVYIHRSLKALRSALEDRE